MRIAPELVRLGVGLLGGGEVAEPTSDLADLVVAARGDHALEVVELLARGERHLLRSAQVAPQAHDLRAVDATRARKAGDVEAVAPPVRSLGPLGRSPVVAQVLARADRDAVDEPGGVRADSAADGGGGRLVEQREPLFDLAALDEGPSLAPERQCLRVPIPEPLCELEGAIEVRERRLEVSLSEHRVDGAGEREACVDGGLGLSFQQALGGCEPALRDRERSTAGVVPRQDEGKARRVEVVPARGECAVGAFPERDRLDQLAPPPRTLGVELEILGGQLFLVDARVGLVRFTPGLARGRFACCVRSVHYLRHVSQIIVTTSMRWCQPQSGDA